MSDMEEETLDLAVEQGTSTRNPHEMSNADLSKQLIMQFQFLSACCPFVGSRPGYGKPGQKVQGRRYVLQVEYLDIGHLSAKKTQDWIWSPRGTSFYLLEVLYSEMLATEAFDVDIVSLDDSFKYLACRYHWKIFSTGFWKNETQVKHTELKILFRKMKNSVIDSKARNTTVKYAYSYKRFVVWSKKYTEIKSVLPANEIYVSLYLQYLMQSAKHYSTIEAACYAIKWVHSLAGFEDPCDSDIVKCIVEASKRKLNRPIQKKDPMNANIMLSLFKKFQGSK
ncbi:unnamed protein product [Mytilus coruscus]|uniref:Uncharacterized protein n=1 Tax=Mytilus coruscus TaxID=42192 RepID=A0A6J8DGH0_MYTCO|nr:unnamed protein product [Mytilus coruscus]